jgi:hypothetical protein
MTKGQEDQPTDLSAPKPGALDHLHSAVRVPLAGIPYFGGPLVELFSIIVQPPLVKRQQKWMADVEVELQKLHEAGFDLDSLAENERFITAVIKASQSASFATIVIRSERRSGQHLRVS